MRDYFISYVEASRVTGVDRQTLAAIPDLKTGAPEGRKYGLVSTAALERLFPTREPASPTESSSNGQA